MSWRRVSQDGLLLGNDRHMDVLKSRKGIDTTVEKPC
jgi:hypothetical protein